MNIKPHYFCYFKMSIVEISKGFVNVYSKGFDAPFHFRLLISKFSKLEDGGAAETENLKNLFWSLMKESMRSWALFSGAALRSVTGSWCRISMLIFINFVSSCRKGFRVIKSFFFFCVFPAIVTYSARMYRVGSRSIASNSLAQRKV